MFSSRKIIFFSKSRLQKYTGDLKAEQPTPPKMCSYHEINFTLQIISIHIALFFLRSLAVNLTLQLMHRLYKTSQLIYVEMARNMKWLCRSVFLFFSSLFTQWSQRHWMWQWINATRVYTLPFVRTKRKSIWAYDKMKLLLAVSLCMRARASAYTNST